MVEHHHYEYDTTGKPALYLHGLGCPEPLETIFANQVRELGYSISRVIRDDAKLLQSSEPVVKLQAGILESLDRFTQRKGEAPVLIGRSLGSYQAMVGYIKAPNQVRAVLGIDAFLDPIEGFAKIQNMVGCSGDEKYVCPLTNGTDIEIDPKKTKSLRPISMLLPHSNFSDTSPLASLFIGSQDSFQDGRELQNITNGHTNMQVQVMQGLDHNQWIELPQQNVRDQMAAFLSRF